MAKAKSIPKNLQLTKEESGGRKAKKSPKGARFTPAQIKAADLLEKEIEALPIGDDRVTSGSVSELRSMMRELTAILCGASTLIEADEAGMVYVEEPVGAAAELLQLALCRCEQLADLIEPDSTPRAKEVAHG